MRFDRSAEGATAADLVNELSEKELARIIGEYGEEKRAKPVAAAIVRERQKGMIGSNSQLGQIVKRVVHPPHQNKSLARIFQALLRNAGGGAAAFSRRVKKGRPNWRDFISFVGRSHSQKHISRIVPKL
jgi:16S rRNA (cytosine1402-N4)-methyltransferase